MFEVQLHQARIVEIGRKVMTGARWIAAHADDRIPNLRRQTLDMFRIPGIVVANLAAASECAWLIAKQKQDNPCRGHRKQLVKCQHASTPPVVEDLPNAFATEDYQRC
jgi:hypothetical protein